MSPANIGGGGVGFWYQRSLAGGASDQAPAVAWRKLRLFRLELFLYLLVRRFLIGPFFDWPLLLGPLSGWTPLAPFFGWLDLVGLVLQLVFPWNLVNQWVYPACFVQDAFAKWFPQKKQAANGEGLFSTILGS